MTYTNYETSSHNKEARGATLIAAFSKYTREFKKEHTEFNSDMAMDDNFLDMDNGLGLSDMIKNNDRMTEQLLKQNEAQVE
jgi:hypothetical protein